MSASDLSCPKCGADDGYHCIDSRPSPEPGVLRRRRQRCDACGFTFTTHEVVVSADGHPLASQQARAFLFLRDMESLVRDHFGDNGTGFFNSSGGLAAQKARKQC